MQTIIQAAEALGVAPALIFDTIASGTIHPISIGDQPTFADDQLDDIQAALPAQRTDLMRRLRDEQVVEEAAARASRMLG